MSHQIRNMFGDPPFLLIFKELWGCNYILVNEFKNLHSKRGEGKIKIL
jgi:hypothetical protein